MRKAKEIKRLQLKSKSVPPISYVFDCKTHIRDVVNDLGIRRINLPFHIGRVKYVAFWYCEEARKTIMDVNFRLIMLTDKAKEEPSLDARAECGDDYYNGYYEAHYEDY